MVTGEDESTVGRRLSTMLPWEIGDTGSVTRCRGTCNPQHRENTPPSHSVTAWLLVSLQGQGSGRNQSAVAPRSAGGYTVTRR